MKWKSIFLLFVTISFQIGAVVASTRSSFGEECSKIKKCDRKAWLFCYGGVCDCSKPEEMFYDSLKGKCVTKSGERCRYGGDENEEGALIEITECVDYSECGEDGICICFDKYHEVFNGTCELSKLFGEVCSDEDKCSKILHLHCVNGSCGCLEGISTYSETEGQCVGSVNQTCIDGKCLAGADCEDGICICNYDHYADLLTNTCVLRKGINENCSDHSECVDKDLLNLKCINEKCDCESGLQYSKVQKSHYTIGYVDNNRHNHYTNSYSYNNRRDREKYIRHSMTGSFVELCAPLLGSKCPQGYCLSTGICRIPSENFENLKRSYDGDEISSYALIMVGQAVCTCATEYMAADKKKTKCGKRWMIGYEFDSSPENHCVKNEDCVNNLVCYKSKCKCPSSKHQQITPGLDFCVSKFGGRCSSTANCVPNSFCKMLDNSTVVGHCNCKEGFVDSKDGFCEGSHGAVCDYAGKVIQCDKAADLVCINRKCSCKDDIMDKYSPALRKCVGLVGAVCQGKKSCIDNAECSELYGEVDLPGRCNCKKGFTESDNFTCESLIKIEL